MAKTIAAAHPDKPASPVTALAKLRTGVAVVPTQTGSQLVRLWSHRIWCSLAAHAIDNDDLVKPALAQACTPSHSAGQAAHRHCSRARTDRQPAGAPFDLTATGAAWHVQVLTISCTNTGVYIDAHSECGTDCSAPRHSYAPCHSAAPGSEAVRVDPAVVAAIQCKPPLHQAVESCSLIHDTCAGGGASAGLERAHAGARVCVQHRL